MKIKAEKCLLAHSMQFWRVSVGMKEVDTVFVKKNSTAHYHCTNARVLPLTSCSSATVSLAVGTDTSTLSYFALSCPYL